MIVNAIVSLVGILVFLFIFWRLLKEDYTSEIIFSSGFIVIAGGLLGILAAKLFFPAWWFWLGFLGLCLGFGAASVKFRLRFYESLEAIVLGMFPLFVLIFLTHAILNSNLFSLLFSVLTASLLLLFYFLNENYKNFTWYRSGRAGFSGLLVLGVFFILRALVSGFSPNVLSFVGKFDAVISGITAFFVFLLLYNLSRSER